MANSREKDIQEILRDFRSRTNILCSTLFTDDGFLIATEQSSSSIPDDDHQSMGALYASINSLAQSGVEILKSNTNIKTLAIQAGDQLDDDGFMVVLYHVREDILLSTIFPSFLNLGVIHFELNQTVQKLSKYLESQDQESVQSKMNTFV